MNTQKSTLYPDKPQVSITSECIAVLVVALTLGIYGALHSQSAYLLLACLCFAFVGTLWYFLPGAVRSIDIETHLPRSLQAGVWSSHTITFTFHSSSSCIPFVVVEGKYNHKSSIEVDIPKIVCSSFRTKVPSTLRMRLRPARQGMVELDGFTIRSLSGLGLFTWSITLPLKQKRPVHPKDITLKPLSLNHGLLEHEEMPSAVSRTSLRGESLGWSRLYHPGDPISSINWKRLALEPHQPTVYAPLPTDSLKVTILLDCSLKKSITTAQDRLILLCEFTKALAIKMQREGAEVNIVICTDTVRQFHLSHQEAWPLFMDSLSSLKVARTSEAEAELQKGLHDSRTKLFYLTIKKNKSQSTAMSYICYDADDVKKAQTCSPSHYSIREQ